MIKKLFPFVLAFIVGLFGFVVLFQTPLGGISNPADTSSLLSDISGDTTPQLGNRFNAKNQLIGIVSRVNLPRAGLVATANDSSIQNP